MSGGVDVVERDLPRANFSLKQRQPDLEQEQIPSWFAVRTAPLDRTLFLEGVTSFTLVPKYGEAREVNVWVWRPTLERIRNAKLIDEKSYKKMGLNDGNVQVDAVTAWKIADLVDRTVEKMGPKDKLLLDLSISDQPAKHGGVLKTEQDVLEGYSVGREWLKDFGVFSRDSGGFGVFGQLGRETFAPLGWRGRLPPRDLCSSKGLVQKYLT